MNKKRLDGWKEYIRGLPHSPLFTQRWEQELVLTISDKIRRRKINRVLEVGCSNGRWLRWFNKEYGCDVWGIDKDDEGFKEGTGDIKFFLGDALHMPYKNNFFDVVLSLGLIEHFPRKEKYQILKEQYRVLSDGGYLICQVPRLNFFSLNFFYIKFFYDYMKGTKHRRTTKRELKKYLRCLGMKIIFAGFTGSLLEIFFHNVLSKYGRFINFLFASEILVVCKK